jgi:hypothetical protein
MKRHFLVVIGNVVEHIRYAVPALCQLIPEVDDANVSRITLP